MSGKGAASFTPLEPVQSPANEGLAHAPGQPSLAQSTGNKCVVKEGSIEVNDRAGGAVRAFLHLPATSHRQSETASDPLRASPSQTAAILVSGAGGGVVGPSSIYLSIADKLASLRNGIPVMRLDYRFPARASYCAADLRAAMSYLSTTYQIEKFVLVGWSFGGAVVFTVGGDDERVSGVATIASQTADAGGIAQMSPRPVLLLHGTGDRTLSPSCSERLSVLYGRGGNCRLELFKGDDHALTKYSSRAEQTLCTFIMWCAGLEVLDEDRRDVVSRNLVSDGDKIRKMEKGGDLRGGENIS